MTGAQVWFIKAINDHVHVSDDAFADLIKLIQAPATIKSFLYIIPLLPDVFSAATKIAKKSDMDSGRYREALKTASLLASVEKVLGDDERLRYFRAPVGTPQFGQCEGLLRTHPLYSALSDTIPQEEYYFRFVQLKAQILLAMESLGTIDEKLLSDLQDPYKEFRYLSWPDHMYLLTSLPAYPVPVATFAQIVKSSFRKTAVKSVIKIFTLAEHPLSLKSKPKKPSAPKSDFNKPVCEDDEEAATEYLSDIQPSTVLTQEESDDYIIHGGLPEELGNDHEFEPVLASDKYHGPTRKQLALQMTQARNHRAMLNQFSAMAWNQANLFDLAVLFDFFEGKNRLDDFDFQPLTRESVIVILGLMFFTSNSLERILSLPVFSGITPQSDSVEGVYFNQGYSVQVRLHSPGPDLSASVQLPGALPVTRYLTVPMSPFFSRCLEQIENSLLPGTVRSLFIDPGDQSNGTESVLSILRSVLGRLNSASGARLSLGRITSYMLFRVAESTRCDLPGAMLFFARNDAIARTRIHYTLADSEFIEATYRNCINTLLDSIGFSGQFIQEEPILSAGYLGTPFCPKETTVSKLVGDMQAKLADLSLTMVERHNYYALYTSTLISFGTGFRAIKDPSFKEIEIDPHWGIGVIADKGNAAYRTRYVYLAPMVIKQINLYREHMQVMYAYLGVTNPSLFNLVKSNDDEGVPLNFFLLSGELEPLELMKPGVVEKILAEEFGYRMRQNAGRHFLKYHLIKDGCSPELLEAFLGHWETGQEPWGQFSNLDPLDFAFQMSLFIPDIMKRSGWQALDRYGR